MHLLCLLVQIKSTLKHFPSQSTFPYDTPYTISCPKTPQTQYRNIDYLPSKLNLQYVHSFTSLYFIRSERGI